MTHAADFLAEIAEIAGDIDVTIVEQLVHEIVALRDRGGRLFLIGVGGSAGNSSHATNDFRKLCGIEAYAAVDNVSELTARANDEGWDTIFSGWLQVSRLSKDDAIFVLSVGGGDAARNVSTNIIKAIDLAVERGARVLGVVGRKDGYVAKRGDVVVVVPTVNAERITPLSEAFQGVVWHCLVSHPALQVCKTKW